MRANFVGNSVVSAMTQTPASGPLLLVTTPPISLARTSTPCARSLLGAAMTKTAKMKITNPRRSASAKCNMVASLTLSRMRRPAFSLEASLTKPAAMSRGFCGPSLSAGETAAVQEGLFIRSGCTPEDGVAVREAAKTPNDIGVDLRPFQAVGVAARFIKCKPALLIREILRMLEREIEKGAHVRVNLGIEAADNSARGHRTRQWIGGKGARVAAEHVARKLIEQDQQCESTFGAVLPAGQLAGRSGLIGVEEPLLDRLVEGLVLGEPAVRSGITPERHDFSCARDHCVFR